MDSAEHEAEEDGIIATAEKEGFIMVLPNGGSNEAGDMSSNSSKWWSEWNGGGMNGSVAGKFGKEFCISGHDEYECYQSCVYAGVCEKAGAARNDCGCSGCADDVEFILVLLKKVKTELCIDDERVHATGMSSGAIFLYYLATTQAVGTQLASIIPVAGSFILGFLDVPKLPLAVLAVHGRRDDIVPANTSNSYKGMKCPVEAVGEHGCAVSSDGWFYHTWDEIAKYWTTANNCVLLSTEVTPMKTQFDGSAGWSCVSHGSKCDATVRSCTHDLGHTFPFDAGKDRKRTREFGQVIWEFMKENSRGNIVV
jgi:polyhydroxybutyrate depolymerase